MPRALVVRAAGTNCEQEMLRGFALGGAIPELWHVDALIADPSRLEAFDLIGFPGGFSFGDDIASGRILAMKLRERLYPALRGAIERGCPMIGACNGFQVLVQVGLLPGPMRGMPWPVDPPPPAQQVALSDNKDARFQDRWVGVAYEPESVCVWTKGLADASTPSQLEDRDLLPVAHGEGRLVAQDDGVLDALERHGQVVLRYRENYNGSSRAIAGICDASGLVFGLMPHPERFLSWHHHPYWTRLDAGVRETVTPGLMMFRNAVSASWNRARPSHGSQRVHVGHAQT
jgi:phosphoribosylformylglycinamidine synthase subunit PurQ / glutaminase